jgi:hypothetical protein
MGWKTRFQFQQGNDGNFLFATVSRPAVGPIFLHIGYQMFFCRMVKWPGRKADHSPPSIDKAKNA